MKSFIWISLLLFFELSFAQKTVRYDLYVSDTTVNYTGEAKQAIAINGQIPAPTLYFTEGDTADIYVHNTLNEETSIHWHGLILPNEQDGVPYLTTAPIKAKTTHHYHFPIKQNGTYWYHSHSNLQEQSGMYGAFIIHKKEAPKMAEYTMVLSDWTNEKPSEVHRKLHNANDWYAIKKGTTQSYTEAIQQGYFSTKITNEWKRMTAMDVSDVYYDRFLINGKPETEAPQFKAGEKVRLRIINGSASTYFWLNYAGGKLSVVANDGMDVEAVVVDRMIIAVAETYDVIVTIPADGSFKFLATAEDRTKSSSLWLGSGTKKPADHLPKLKYFEGMKMMNDMMSMNGSMMDMGMQMSNQQMDMNTVMYPEIIDSNKTIVTLNYGMLRSPVETTLPAAPVKTLHFNLSGNMNRYVWSIDNKTVSETDKILIKKGENVRIILYNGSMMRHPMHLHGHFFRVLNGQGAYSPLKNVLDIMPMETDTIEFAATESGDWFFHCHILYHMMSGMGRIFSYENSPPNPELPDPKAALRKVYNDDKQFHFMFQNSVESNGNDGEAMLANTRWQVSSEWRLGYHDVHGYEVENHVGRYIDKMQWLMPFVGFDWRYRKKGINFQEKNIFGQTDTKDTRTALSLGVQFTLPMLVKLETEVFTNGTFLIQMKREDIPIGKRLRMNLMVNTDKEYMVGLRYIATKNIAIASHYDSDMGLGGGITITY
jgi:FtsP/CotA-like multicopper oxidase with cupredoxin domain